MSVNVAIVEDESEYARELQDYLRRYGREVGGTVRHHRIPRRRRYCG